MKKVIMSMVVAISLIAATYGAAASIGINAANLGAGDADVLTCAVQTDVS